MDPQCWIPSPPLAVPPSGVAAPDQLLFFEAWLGLLSVVCEHSQVAVCKYVRHHFQRKVGVEDPKSATPDRFRFYHLIKNIHLPSIFHAFWKRDYREKKQKFSLIHKLATRWRIVSKLYFVYIVILLMALKGSTTGMVYEQNQLTLS